MALVLIRQLLKTLNIINIGSRIPCGYDKFADERSFTKTPTDKPRHSLDQRVPSRGLMTINKPHSIRHIDIEVKAILCHGDVRVQREKSQTVIACRRQRCIVYTSPRGHRFRVLEEENTLLKGF